MLTQKDTRHYGLDLLRIIAMYLIVVIHVLGNGGVNAAAEKGSLALVAGKLLYLAGCPMVNCYAMLSGYVGGGRKNRFATISTMWLQVFLYSLGIALIVYFINGTTEGLKDAFFPVLTNRYWYFTAYLYLFLLMPLLNVALEKLSVGKLMAILIAVLCTAFASATEYDVFGFGNGYSGKWLICMYLLGGLLAKLRVSGKAWKWGLAYVGMVVLCYFAQVLGKALGWNTFNRSFYVYNSPQVLLTALAMFMFCVSLKIDSNSKLAKVIKVVSPLTFGVYLIHTQQTIFLGAEGIFGFLGQGSLGLLLAGVLLGSAAIFVVCAVIEWLRIKLFELLRIRKLMQKLGDLLDKAWQMLLHKLKIA